MKCTIAVLLCMLNTDLPGRCSTCHPSDVMGDNMKQPLKIN